MHKYFAKPLFLGKKVEFLPECHSTNEELHRRAKNTAITEGYLLYTDYQIKGRGQRGNAWVSQSTKNLLFSLFLKPVFLFGKESYWLNIIVGLAIVKVLKEKLPQKEVTLKWPNDAFVLDRKVGGILIETSIGSKMLDGAVVGVGLNVNQDYFALPTASSIKLESTQEQDRYQLLENFLVYLEGYYLKLKSGNRDAILHEYYSCLRWRGEHHYFKSQSGQFSGEIIGIDDSGRLVINSNNTKQHFDIKEIEFLY